MQARQLRPPRRLFALMLFAGFRFHAAHISAHGSEAEC